MKMVEVKTAELIGSALDWAVAKADGFRVQYSRRMGLHCAEIMRVSAAETFIRMGCSYCPSTDWSQGGPLIEKYRVGIYCDYTPSEAITANVTGSGAVATGETFLIAACRAIVAANLGDVVSVPAELINEGGL